MGKLDTPKSKQELPTNESAEQHAVESFLREARLYAAEKDKLLSPEDQEAYAGGDPMQHLFKDIVQEEFDFEHTPSLHMNQDHAPEFSAIDEAIRTSLSQAEALFSQLKQRTMANVGPSANGRFMIETIQESAAESEPDLLFQD